MGNKFILGQEDGTVAGGNARGDGAVDLQISRTASNQVASGSNSTITGGQNNRIIGPNGFIGSGNSNFINSTATPGMVICGGRNNTILQNDQGTTPNFIGGGASNTVQGGYSMVIGGNTNNAGGYNVNHSIILGGDSNAANAQNAVVLGGVSNNASGAKSVILAGNNNSAAGLNSVASGSYSVANADYSNALGYGALASFPGQLSVSTLGSYYGLVGAGPAYAFSDLLAYNLLDSFTTGQTLILYPGNSNAFLLKPANFERVWHVTAKYTMYVATKIGTVDLINAGDTLFGTASFGYKSGAGGFVTSTFQDNKASNNTNLNTASFAYSFGSSNELKITFTAPTFTGGGQLRIRCNVKLELVETLQGIGNL
jgi:hypothetical protein